MAKRKVNKDTSRVVSCDIAIFDKADVIALDFETGDDKYEDEEAGSKGSVMTLFSIAGMVSGRKYSSAYLPSQFKPFFKKNKGKRFVFHNAKFDLQVMLTEGIDIWNLVFEDTLIMAHLLDENRRKGLKQLRVSELGLPERAAWGAVDKKNLKEYMEYAQADADDTLELYHKFRPLIAEEDLEVAYALEKAVLYPVIDMETHGVKIDVALLKEQDEKLGKRVEEIYHEIVGTIGYEINLSSPKQVADLFFNILRYPPQESWRGKTGYSTAEAVLVAISKDSSPQHADAKHIAELLLDHRTYKKLKTSFTSSLLSKLQENGYIYPSFNSVGTVTGRFSASNPNLQQVPGAAFDHLKDAKGNYLLDDEGKKIEDPRCHIRSLFIVEEDEYLMTVDYSQIELRMMAELSRDRTMCNAFIGGADLHQVTASALGIDRKHAKTLNFGIGYGMSATGFSANTGLPMHMAQRFINGFWKTYPGLYKFAQYLDNMALSNGFLRSVSGRKRRFYQMGGNVHTTALNFVVQGSSADVMKAAMIAVWKSMDRSKARMIMQVHDELSFAVKRGYENEMKEIVQYHLENTIKTMVPLIAEPHIGLRWSESK